MKVNKSELDQLVKAQLSQTTVYNGGTPKFADDSSIGGCQVSDRERVTPPPLKRLKITVER